MDDELKLVSDAVSVELVRRLKSPFRFLYIRQEREREEEESLRAELLNDPHTLLLLPCIREHLYIMSFTLSFISDRCTESFLDWQEAVGIGEENRFRVCDELLNLAKSHSLARWKFLQRCVEDKTYYYLVGLDILLRKVFITSNGHDILRSFNKIPGEMSFLQQVCFDTLVRNAHDSFDLTADWDRDDSTSYAMIVAAVVVLLFCVCQYLVLFVDRGRGSRSYSSGSVDFRDVFVSIVLFRGAYVWIKFRQATASQTSHKRKSCEAQDHVPGVYPRAVKDKSGIITHYKYEPRFKPRREKSDSGVTLQFSHLSLGAYDTPGEAKIVVQIAGFYYGAKDAGDRVEHEDGSSLVIPAMDEHEKRLTGLIKAKWVTERAKKLFKELHLESAVKSRKQSRTANAAVELDGTDRVYSGHEGVPEAEFWGAKFNVAEMENEASEPCGHGNSSRCDGEATMSAFDQLMFDEPRFGSASISSQAQSTSGLGIVSEILGDASPPKFDNGAAHEFVAISNLNCGQWVESLGAFQDECTVTNVSEPVTERGHHPLVSRQKELLEKYAIRVADLEHQLLGAEVKNSELQREIEHLRAAKAQEAAAAAAKSQVGTWWADFVLDFPS